MLYLLIIGFLDLLVFAVASTAVSQCFICDFTTCVYNCVDRFSVYESGNCIQFLSV